MISEFRLSGVQAICDNDCFLNDSYIIGNVILLVRALDQVCCLPFIS